ncbi:MAG: ceramide glucosyltransferase [Lysobacteraceae bacterium]|nr:MAG: ceramide glucosyltransferase [Xanthomonadaceae bacterium]
MSALTTAIIASAWPLCEALRQLGAWRVLRAMPRPNAQASGGIAWFADVDVLQAVRGGDPTLTDTLSWNLRELGRHGARLHWLLDEDDHIARDAAETALAASPTLRAQVRIAWHPPCPCGMNPKLFKLDRALSGCPGDIVMVLDDDARLPVSTLEALRHALRTPTASGAATSMTDAGNAVSIATALPAYLPAHNLASRWLAAFVNDNAALTYLPPRRHGSPTINGMAWAMRRDALDAIGGFEPHLRHLTDDLAMARAVLRVGGHIEQRSEPVWMRTELAGIGAYRRQMHRWMLFAKLLFATQPRALRLRILFGQALPVVLPHVAVAACCIAPDAAAAALAVGALTHLYGRAALQRACTATRRPLHPLASFSAAALLPLHLLHAWLAPRIRWREHRYRVYAEDRYEELP